jgi:hypothetical protein
MPGWPLDVVFAQQSSCRTVGTPVRGWVVLRSGDMCLPARPVSVPRAEGTSMAVDVSRRLPMTAWQTADEFTPPKLGLAVSIFYSLVRPTLS